MRSDASGKKSYVVCTARSLLGKEVCTCLFKFVRTTVAAQEGVDLLGLEPRTDTAYKAVALTN